MVCLSANLSEAIVKLQMLSSLGPHFSHRLKDEPKAKKSITLDRFMVGFNQSQASFFMINLGSILREKLYSTLHYLTDIAENEGNKLCT